MKRPYRQEGRVIFDATSWQVATAETVKDANEIITCVNACEGLGDDPAAEIKKLLAAWNGRDAAVMHLEDKCADLGNKAHIFMQERDSAKAQRDDLSTALTELVGACESYAASKPGQRVIVMQRRDRAMHAARAALARVSKP